MMIYLTIFTTWALGSALFVMALALAVKGQKETATEPNAPTETAEDILHRLHLTRETSPEYAIQGRQARQTS
jgi:hypothetical protein